MGKTIETVGKKQVLMKLCLNGEPVSKVVKAGRRLIDFLRDDLHLYGTKEGCGEGECGSCTVFLERNSHSVMPHANGTREWRRGADHRGNRNGREPATRCSGP